MSLGKNILNLRKKCGLSQEKLGEKINVSRQTISNWELGETSPNSEQLILLSKELNVSIDELLNSNINMMQECSKPSNETRRKLTTWEIVFLVITFPIWLPMLITIFSIILSIYIVIWSIIISLWAIWGSIVGVALSMILSGIPFIFSNTNLIGIAMISVGIICIGLSILLFFGCKVTTKGLIILTNKFILWIKNIFKKREVS